MGEWQPIETAPKDGTRVLIYDTDMPEITTAEFESGCWWVYSREYQAYPQDVTHWMCLPEPPK